MPQRFAGMFDQAYKNGYDKAIADVLWHLRYADWQEDTAGEAIVAKFGAGFDLDAARREAAAKTEEER